MNIISPTRVCRKCGNEKDINEFYNANKSTYRRVCKVCLLNQHRANYEKNKERYLEKKREYYYAHAEYNKGKKRRYWEQNKDKLIPKNRLYYHSHKEHIREKAKEYRERNKDAIRAKSKKNSKISRLKTKLDVLTFYGNSKCSCVQCGESRIDCLSIDHINGGGSKHRKETAGHIYSWLREHKYPLGYQTLCMNCQFIKKQHDLDARSSYDKSIQ